MMKKDNVIQQLKNITREKHLKFKIKSLKFFR